MKLPSSIEYFLKKTFIPYGSRPWMYFSIALFGLRFARRVVRGKPEPILRFKVNPGERYEIRGITRDR
jgi:hypothetical protein